MQQPSRETLIRFFKGQSLPYEMELVRIYLAMETDQDFVESCMQEARADETNQLHISDHDVEKFMAAFYSRQAQLEQLPPLDQQPMEQRRILRIPRWIRVAAAAVLVIGLGLLALYQLPEKQRNIALNHDVLPGSEKATLTLADGSVVLLSDTENGQIAEQGNVKIEKTAEGEILYKKISGAAISAVNRIATPKGGYYRVTLPDGSVAWLNAASSLSYPVQFDAGERKVKMTGEVYFDIAKLQHDVNGKKERVPFYVETDKQQIQVLGTRFNVNAYNDEPHITTTLEEGRIKLISVESNQSVLLEPGQQALLNDEIIVKPADLEEALAWKSGDFIFKKEELQSILRKISRWYDVDIECPLQLGKLKISGMVSRHQSLATVTESISSLGKVTLTIKERRLIVTE